MNQISKTTQQNAAASEQLSATAEQMSQQAVELQRSLEFFKIAKSQTNTKPIPGRAENKGHGFTPDRRFAQF